MAFFGVERAAAQSYWENPAGGNFHDPANWSGGVPGIAAFRSALSLPGNDFGVMSVSGPVWLTDNVTADFIEGPAYPLVLRLNGHELVTDRIEALGGELMLESIGGSRGLFTANEVFSPRHFVIGQSVDASVLDNVRGGFGTGILPSIFSLTVRDGGSLSVGGNVDLETQIEGGGPSLRAVGAGSIIDVAGDLLPHRNSAFDFPVYRVFVEDEAVLRVAGDFARSVADEIKLDTSVLLSNGILDVDDVEAVDDRDLRGYGVVVSPIGEAAFTGKSIATPEGQVELNHDLTLSGNNADVARFFSVGPAIVGSGASVDLPPVVSPSGLLIRDEAMLIAEVTADV
ncbi:MAG: hypothetical protein AAF961_06275, partial [Planctomycetota bacterium]